ncbi:MAG: sugar phosphate nucleotidyltransferase, partial [Planctomycetota bacterium]
MKAILLCAGYATRLRPLTENCPKHLLEVKGKPIISHVIDKIRSLPLDGIYVVTNNKFFTHFQEWSHKLEKLPFPLKVLNDGTLSNNDRLGSIGDV